MLFAKGTDAAAEQIVCDKKVVVSGHFCRKPKYIDVPVYIS